MEQKKFNCKNESLPVIGSFLLLSFVEDKQQFISFSPVFNTPFEDNLRAKIAFCSEMVVAEDLVKQQKEITKKIEKTLTDLRVKLNPIEGYIKLAVGLDVSVNDFGLKKVREGINDKKPEDALSGLKTLAANLARNKTVLETVGYKTVLIDDITAATAVITSLNEQQNEFKNKRSRTADEVLKEYNLLFDMMSIVFNAGKAIFKGVDDVKLREYTFSIVKKRVDATIRSTDEKPDESKVA